MKQLAWCFVAALALGACGGNNNDNDSSTDADTGESLGDTLPDVHPDVRPDGEPPDGPVDGAPDGIPDGPIDVPPDRPDIDDGRDRGEVPDGGPEGYDGAGGCDPTMCSISCLVGGSGSGECVGDVCECSGSSDGGTGDGTLPDIPLDGILDIPLDGIIPDGILPDGIDISLPDGFDISLPDGFDIPEGFDFGGGPDSTIDMGTSCDMATCFTACRDAGSTFGFCDASGVCVCY
jgi:hypothetical protein